MHKVDLVAEISIKYGELKSYIDWCKQNCYGDWNVRILSEAGNNPGNYQFSFSNERDYTTFLVWKS